MVDPIATPPTKQNVGDKADDISMIELWFDWKNRHGATLVPRDGFSVQFAYVFSKNNATAWTDFEGWTAPKPKPIGSDYIVEWENPTDGRHTPHGYDMLIVRVEISPPPGAADGVCVNQTIVARCTSSATNYDAYPTVAVQTWSAPNGESVLADLSPYFKAVSKVDDSLIFTRESRPALEYNKEYVIRCSATAADPNHPGTTLPAVSDQATIRIIGPPASVDPGTCTVSPTQGTFMSTSFTVTCSNWKPPFNAATALPLSYSLKLKEAVLVKPGESNVMTPAYVFPVGTHELTATICSNNACGCSDVPLTITVVDPPVACATYDATMASISERFAAGTITEKEKTILEGDAIAALSEFFRGKGPPPCLDKLITDACSASSAADRLKNLASSTGDIATAYPELAATLAAITKLASVSSSFLNSTLLQKLTSCKPAFDPCDFLELDLSVYLEQTTEELSAAIASPDWVGTAGTGLTGQTESSSSPLANLLNTLIKAPQGALAKYGFVQLQLVSS
eukprot:tig00000180_g13625.t1